MGNRLAILACGGALPVQIASAHPDAVKIGLSGVRNDLDGNVQLHSLEKLGTLFAALKTQKVDRIVLAGALTRPSFDPKEFDSAMMSIAPRLVAAMQGGTMPFCEK